MRGGRIRSIKRKRISEIADIQMSKKEGTMWWNKKCEVWKKEEDDGEIEGEWEREKDSWQIPGLWSSVLSAQEISRCAKVTLYNNSFGFMLWVVYTLCVPRDNHEVANDPGSYFYCSRPVQKPTSLSLFTTIRRRCRCRWCVIAHSISWRDFAAQCHRDLSFVMASSPFRNNFPCEIIDIIATS